MYIIHHTAKKYESYLYACSWECRNLLSIFVMQEHNLETFSFICILCMGAIIIFLSVSFSVPGHHTHQNNDSGNDKKMFETCTAKARHRKKSQFNKNQLNYQGR